jgi:ribosomal protein S18 acetylase RimI-like enzyme
MLAIDKISTESDWSIHQLDESYAEQIARLHQHALPEDVLPALGARFLIDYYNYALNNRSQVILGAISEGKVVGFCQLSFTPISVASVIKSTPYALMRLLCLGLTKPAMFIRGMLAMFVHPRLAPESAEISFIAVHLTFQGCGVGKRLIIEAGRAALNRGSTALTTKTTNELARSIYEKSFAAKVVTTFSFFGRRYWYLSWAVNGMDNCEK